MSIRYLLIDTDGVGSFGVQPDPGYTTSWLDGLVGPEGWDRMPLWRRMTGFVNDCGHKLPDTYPRNMVGSVLLATFGAPLLPYAGPVVITGWDEQATARGDLEICTLTDLQVEDLTLGLTDVRRAMGMDNGPVSRGPNWATIVRAYAEQVRTAPTPTMRVLSGEDAIAALYGRRAAP